MIKDKLKIFNIQDYLNTKEEVKEYFEAVLEEYEPDYFPIATDNIVKSKGYAEICKKRTSKNLFNKDAIQYFTLVFEVIDKIESKLAHR